MTGCCGKSRNNAGDPVYVSNNWDGKGGIHICRDGEMICPNLGKSEHYFGHFLDSNDIENMPTEEIVRRLGELGIRVILLTDKEETDQKGIRDVINLVASSPYSQLDSFENLRYRSCFLYRDIDNRLWNITLTGGEGLEDKWHEQDVVYSGTQGAVLMFVLTRIFPCASEGFGLAPALLGLFVGLVFREEISNTHVAVGLHVCGLPSVGAFVFKGYWVSDWPKRLVLLVLGLTGVASTLPVDNLQTYFILTSVSITCTLLAANLGSRAWKHLEIPPMRLAHRVWTPIGFLAAYFLAVLLGLLVPFLGMRQVYRGGHHALRSVNIAAFTTALFYILSDFDIFQKYLVEGAENCNQDLANIFVGFWLIIATLASIGLYKRIPKKRLEPEPKKFLVDSHKSPVGLIISLLPNYDIDTKETAGPSSCPESVVFALAFPIALIIGAMIMALGFVE